MYKAGSCKKRRSLQGRSGYAPLVKKTFSAKRADIIGGLCIPEALPAGGAGDFMGGAETVGRMNQFSIKKITAQNMPVKDTLDAAGLFYNKTETWIDSEKLYEVLYSFDMEGM